MRRTMLLWSICVALTAPVQAAQPEVPLADALIAKAGLSGGIVAMPRSGDGALALDIARNPRMLVHAMDAERKNVIALVSRADAAGLLARRLYVEQGNPSAMLLADNCVDLVLIADLSDADLAGIPPKEIVRVLSPMRGQAIVGRAKSATGGPLSKAALEQWVKASGQGDVTIEEDALGLWARFRKPAPAGADQWSHRFHGPDNNLFSQDTALRGPLATQWLSLPLHDGWWGTAIVSAGGRLFTIYSPRDNNDRDRTALTARSLYNGTVLWERPFRAKKGKVAYNPARCCMIATPERLYLIDGDGVLLLDAESGAERGRLAGPQEGGQIKWMALADGVLVMLVGEPDIMKDIGQMYAANARGTLLAAYDVAGGRQLWRHEEAKPIDQRMVAIHAGRLFAHARGLRTFCLDLKTGSLRWTNTDPAALAVIDFAEKPFIHGTWVAMWEMIAVDEAVIVGAQWAGKLAVLSPDTGKLMCQIGVPGWSKTIGFAAGGKWWGDGDLIDLVTGKPAGKKKVLGDGCGPSVGTPLMIVTGFGRCVDAANDYKFWTRAEVKAPCDMGTLVSGGVAVTPPSMCGCNMEGLGYRAVMTAGEDFEGDSPIFVERKTGESAKAPEDTGRLVVASKEPAAALAVSPADWPTYRGNVARSGATAADVPRDFALRWRWSPAKPVEFEPSVCTKGPGRFHTTSDPQHSATPAIAAAGKVWFGDAAGIVRCLDAASGKPLWSFVTPAKLFAPPTLFDGRLYVGGGDGCVYCLDASTGRELWRFHAAPHERRIMWYGHLLSTWPVISGVTVHDGVAYAAAGYTNLNGVHVYALDAATGQLRWANHTPGLAPDSDSGVRGTMTVACGRLWLASGTYSPSSFDLKTGDSKVVHKERAPGAWIRAAWRGQEVGVLADRFLVYGGRRLPAGYDERVRNGSPTGVGVLGLDDKGLPLPPEAMMLHPTTFQPVWDGSLMMMGRMGNTDFGVWPVPKLTALLGETVAAAKSVEMQWPGVKSPSEDRLTAMRSWQLPKLELSAAALARNALVLTHAQPPKGDPAAKTKRPTRNAPPPKEMEPEAWMVTALDREAGAQLASATLPCEPAFDGLSIDRQGQILVTLRDGSLACYGAKGAP